MSLTCSPLGCAGKEIFIVGPRRLQNQIMATFLESQTGATCVSVPDFVHVASPGREKNHPPRIALYDCLGKGLKACMQMIDDKIGVLLPFDFVVLFNLRNGIGIEERALGQGVRGFFYDHDPLEVFPKGIETIFNNELWVSRKILTRYVVNNGYSNKKGKKRPAGLTRRECEILLLVSSGASNRDVADRLGISFHTVKTHLYNIFKKIGVRDRFQAALWGANSL